MYLGLALFPWMLMYALSTLAMNHRAMFTAQYGSGPVPFVIEREMTYDRLLLHGSDLRTISTQILASVGLDGAHGRIFSIGSTRIPDAPAALSLGRRPQTSGAP